MVRLRGDRGEKQLPAHQVRAEGAGGREQAAGLLLLLRERRVHVLLDERRLQVHLR